MTGGNRLHALTIARGPAAWLVVLFHIRSTMPWLPDSVRMLLDKGYLAVDVFFLLSGFVIYLSAHQAFRERGLAVLPDFLLRRIARIYPLYGVMLALTVLFAGLLWATGRDTSGYPWAELPLHILMLHNWSFTQQLSWNHPAWAISTELAAYLLFPLIVAALPLHRLPRWALAAGILALIQVMAMWMRTGGLTHLGEEIPRFGLVRCLFEFTAGCLLCALWLKETDKSRRVTQRIAWLTMIIAAWFWVMSPVRELWAFPAIAVAALYLLANVSRPMAQAPQTAVSRAFLYLGELSYAVYISHFMLFIWFKIALVEDAADVPPVLIALFFGLTLVFAALLHHGVEKPVRSLVTRHAGEKAQAAPAGAA